MKTFTKIEDLIRQVDSLRESDRIMQTEGMHIRTDSGMRFFMQQQSRINSYECDLSSYPCQWVEAVRLIMEMRKSSN